MKAAPYRVRVRLVCDCVVNLREFSRNPKARLTCPMNLGHPYNQRWVSYENPSGVFQNRELAAKV